MWNPGKAEKNIPEAGERLGTGYCTGKHEPISTVLGSS